MLFRSELVLADGSRLRNDFVRAEANVPLPEGWLASPVDSTWKVTEPFGGARP